MKRKYVNKLVIVMWAFFSRISLEKWTTWENEFTIWRGQRVWIDWCTMKMHNISISLFFNFSFSFIFFFSSVEVHMFIYLDKRNESE